MQRPSCFQLVEGVEGGGVEVGSFRIGTADCISAQSIMTGKKALKFWIYVYTCNSFSEWLLLDFIFLFSKFKLFCFPEIKH